MKTRPWKNTRWLCTASTLSALAVLLLGAATTRAETLPPVIDRYERLLVHSPGKGTAFDKVYQYYFEGEGLEKLAARWKAQAEAPGADAATYWLLLGVLSERQGKSPEAIRLYEKAAGLKPADARIWSALGDAQAAAGSTAGGCGKHSKKRSPIIRRPTCVRSCFAN